MTSKRIIFSLAILIAFLIVISVSIRVNKKSTEKDKLDYQQDLNRINSANQSFKPDLTNNLEEYENFADEIQKKWKSRNPENYAKLMLEICKPLSSGTFESRRRFDLAREYALFALNNPNKITLNTELELIGHVMTNAGLPFSPKEKELAQRRKEDIEIRLHAWNRLLNSIDFKWDPNEVILSPNAVAAEFGFPGSVNPQTIKDITLRAEYEAAIEAYRQKNERYIEQNKLHKWLKRYPERAEKYIVQLYSAAPYDTEELKQLLEKYNIDRETQTRIINAVESNIKKEAETQERLNKLRGQ